MSVRPIQLDIYRTRIPMRSFEHAAKSRDVSEGIVVRVEFSDGRLGWGETLPRQYVTGETPESVIRDLQEIIFPICAGQTLQGEIPTQDREGRCINAATCAADLGLLRRIFNDDGTRSDGLREMAGRSEARKTIDTRVSGVLGSTDPSRTAKRLRLMRLFGMRDFKLKLGFGEDTDRENLRVVTRQIGKGVSREKYTLRVDVNGAWDAQTTPDRVEELVQDEVCVVEQPVFCSAGELVDLSRKCSLPLMADETLITDHDARILLQSPAQVWWNIRLSKNGGFLRSLSLAQLAAEHDIPFTVGCMVGETSILSRAQRILLQWSPPPRFVEGNYGKFLLKDDLVYRPLRFGYGGRLRVATDATRDVDVDPEKLQRYAHLVASLRA